MSETFRETYKSFVGQKDAPKYTNIAEIFKISQKTSLIPNINAIMIPEMCIRHLKKLHELKTPNGLFFESFVVFSKGHYDGMLMGFGRDGIYYILAVWDAVGFDLWQPQPK
jgi:hypothetical protein